MRVAGGGPGRYGVSPFEWVVPHKVGTREKPFPCRYCIYPTAAQGGKNLDGREDPCCFRLFKDEALGPVD
jgi:hypothetical protein